MMRSRLFRVVVVVVLCGLSISSGVVAIGVLQNLAISRDLEAKIVGINGHIFAQGTDARLDDDGTLAARLQALPGVRLAVPLVEFLAGISSDTQQAGALVRGIRERDLKTLPGLAGRVISGTFDSFDHAGGVAIGQQLADSLGVRVGDSVSIITAKSPGTAPRFKSYPVTATFRVGMAQFDALIAFMPLSEAQAFSDHEGELTAIELFLTSPADVDAVRVRIDAAARPIVLTDWHERNKTFFAVMRAEVRRIILVLCLFVAATVGMAAVVWKLLVSARASFPPQP